MASVADLNTQFGIPGIAQVVAGNGALPAVQVTTKTASGTVYLHGAHVTHWAPADKGEVLWLSGKSMWENNKPIRGGVPLCFPWFGPNKNDPTAPAHGFARLREWTLEKITRTGDDVTVTLALKSDDATKKAWNADFTLRLHVTFAGKLTMKLELTNTGSAPITAEEAQHTYFHVADVREVAIKGLNGVNYLDKVDGAKEKTQAGDIAIIAETDRVYLNTASPVTVEHAAPGRTLEIHKLGSHATVVWNPWVAKAKAMADFGDEEWPHMLCVETCNVGPHAITVAPGQTHVMQTEIVA